MAVAGLPASRQAVRKMPFPADVSRPNCVPEEADRVTEVRRVMVVARIQPLHASVIMESEQVETVRFASRVVAAEHNPTHHPDLIA
jgi:hypothetical protein